MLYAFIWNKKVVASNDKIEIKQFYIHIDVCDAMLGKCTEWSPGRAGGGPPGIIRPKAAVLSLLLVLSLFVRCNL